MKPNSYLIFDTETTGLPGMYGYPKITELCLLAVHRDDLAEDGVTIPRVVNKLSMCFNPLKFITPGSSMLTGLFNDALERQQPFNHDTVAVIKGFISNQPQPVCFIAHNGDKFDFPLLMSELIRVRENLPTGLLCADSLLAFRELDADCSGQYDTGVKGQGCDEGQGQKSSVDCPVGDGFAGCTYTITPVSHNQISQSMQPGVTPSKRDATFDRESEQIEFDVPKRPRKDINRAQPQSVSQRVVKRLDYGQRDGTADPSRQSLQTVAKVTKTGGTKVDTSYACTSKSSPSLHSLSYSSSACQPDRGSESRPALIEAASTQKVADGKTGLQHPQLDSQGSIPDDEFLAAVLLLEEGENDICSGDGPSGSMMITVPGQSDAKSVSCTATSAGLATGTDPQPNLSGETVQCNQAESTELQHPKSKDNSGKTYPQQSKYSHLQNSDNRTEGKTVVNGHRSNCMSEDNIIDEDSLPGSRMSSRSLFSSIGKTKQFARSTLPSANRRSFRLGDIYKRHFGHSPEVSHTAEDDCIVLLKLVKKFSPSFLEWVDCNCSHFDNVTPMH